MRCRAARSDPQSAGGAPIDAGRQGQADGARRGKSPAQARRSPPPLGNAENPKTPASPAWISAAIRRARRLDRVRSMSLALARPSSPSTVSSTSGSSKRWRPGSPASRTSARTSSWARSASSMAVDGLRSHRSALTALVWTASCTTKAPVPSTKTCAMPPTWQRTSRSTSGTSTTASARPLRARGLPEAGELREWGPLAWLPVQSTNACNAQHRPVFCRAS
ncbi:hypothetical protein SAMN05216567_12835 [Variovorax sp. OK605]|nr:hypothetical protein SAMN05216567_12835 [Variovorax sp. OK605]